MYEPHVEKKESPEKHQRRIGGEGREEENQRDGKTDAPGQVWLANGRRCEETACIENGNPEGILKGHYALECNGIRRIRKQQQGDCRRLQRVECVRVHCDQENANGYYQDRGQRNHPISHIAPWKSAHYPVLEVEIRHADFPVKSAHGFPVLVVLPEVDKPAVPIQPVVEENYSVGQESIPKDQDHPRHGIAGGFYHSVLKERWVFS